MGRHLLLACIIALGAVVGAQAAELEGNWARGDGKARVRIAGCGADICATNTWIKPGTEDEKAGDVLVLKVSKVSADSYSGSAFDPQRDRTYKIILDVGDSTMTTRGCVLGGLLCKDVGWTRIN